MRAPIPAARGVPIDGSGVEHELVVLPEAVNQRLAEVVAFAAQAAAGQVGEAFAVAFAADERVP